MTIPSPDRLRTLSAFIHNQAALVTLPGGKVVQGVGEVRLNNEEALLCADALDSHLAGAGAVCICTGFHGTKSDGTRLVCRRCERPLPTPPAAADKQKCSICHGPLSFSDDDVWCETCTATPQSATDLRAAIEAAGYQCMVAGCPAKHRSKYEVCAAPPQPASQAHVRRFTATQTVQYARDHGGHAERFVHAEDFDAAISALSATPARGEYHVTRWRCRVEMTPELRAAMRAGAERLLKLARHYDDVIDPAHDPAELRAHARLLDAAAGEAPPTQDAAGGAT